MKKINSYRSKIFVYRKRRDALKKKYLKKLASYRSKLKVWNRDMKRLKARVVTAKGIIKATNEYFQVDITVKTSTQKTVFARNCFFKYAMDKKLEGSMLVEILGYKYPAKAYRDRKRFIRSFQTNQQNKILYHQFKKYIDSTL